MARKFYYDADGEKLGPVTGQELIYLRAEGEISDNTWVRPEDSQTWRPYAATDLREERKKQSGAGGLWRQLFRNLSPTTKIVMGLVAFTMLMLVGMAFYYLWPILLFVIALYILNRALKSK